MINSDKEFLNWIYERMICVHGEKDLYDYMINFKSVIDRQPDVKEEQDINTWFSLSYAQYLTIPRSVLEAMPIDWQHKFTRLLSKLDETIDWRPESGRYWVKLKDGNGRYVHDRFMEYRRPDAEFIKSKFTK